MRKAMSIQIEEDFGAYIDHKVSEGEYKTRADVVEAGLRLLREQDEEHEAIRQALIEGEESGEDTEFDSDTFLKQMHEKYVVRS